jgi:hypothetical protein
MIRFLSHPALWLVLAAAASRLVPHIPNVTPISAMALLGGFAFSGKRAYLLPLAALLLSDAFIGFHNLLPFVYLPFLLTVWMGRQLQKTTSGPSASPTALAVLSLSSSLIFFLSSNFGVWFASTLYPRNALGLAACYTAALPFFRNALLGDLVYTAFLFSFFAWASKNAWVLAKTTSQLGTKTNAKR